MEAKIAITKPNPYDEANFINRNFFWWMNSFFLYGYKNELKVGDLYKCPLKDRSERLGSRLQLEWDKELNNKRKKKPSLLRAMIRTFGFWYFMSGSLSILAECIIRILQPIIMGFMVKYLEKYQGTKDEKEASKNLTYFYLSAAGICIMSIAYVLAIHPYFFKMTRKGMQVRIACCNLIYRKALKLSRGALGRTTVGQMVNLLSNDVNRFDLSFIFIPFIAVGPLQTLVIILYLYFAGLEWRVLVGCSVLGFYVPFQFVMGKLFSILRLKTAILTDERIRLMNEIIPAMRVIKMYTWEKPFAKLVEIARRNEVKMIKKTSILRGVNMALFFVSSKIMLFLCFVSYVLSGGHLTAEIVFVSMSLFNNLRSTMTLYFPYGISQGSEAMISISRLQHFLLLEEKDESCKIDNISSQVDSSETGVWMNDVIATWCPQLNQLNDQQEPTLNKVTFSVRPGELLVVVGSVGSGKSSVLMGVLGELPILSGEVKVRGKIAYASQEAWSFAGTIKENVLFGSTFDETKYRNVLHVCALEKDLNLFPYGDQTMVGERGVSLSGGQKARVNLARALYCDADIYLLDDPLSAVDAAVAKHIFEKCIRGYLKDKVVILVTHQLQFIKNAHQILLLNDGKTQAHGNYQQLVNSGIDFIKLSGEDKPDNQQNKPVAKSGSFSEKSVARKDSFASSIGGDEDEPAAFAGEAPQRQQEMNVIGSVKGAIYWLYIRAGAGIFLLPLLITSNLITQFLFNGSDYYLSLWTESEQHKYGGTNITYTKTFVDHLDRQTNIIIYTCLIGGLFLFSLVRTTAFYIICMRASITLHNRLFESVIRAPISFFDNNPIGVLLNRCSRDMGIIDDMLPPTAFDALEIFVNLIGILIMNSIIDYFIVLPTFILIFIFYWLRKFYIRTARNVKRLEGITKSPVFSHLANSLYGLATLRAFGAQKAFEKKFDHFQDEHTASFFLFIAATRWFGIYLDWLCVIYTIAVTVTLSFTGKTKPSSDLGLAISLSIMLTGMFQWGVRQSAEVESQMTSVERINQYSHLPSETNLESTSDDKRPPKEWPQNGAIIFEDVSMQYHKDDPPVLKNLNFKVKPKEKVGIVGRTGAGKSSMIAALFRMSEPTGKIEIDGIDTKNIALSDLRKKISIIPQDPVLFTGPVRRNIDPFNEHTDERLWEVLEEVRLKEAVKDLGGGIDADLSEGGSNFSVGQRQMICLARAILKQNRILVLDEATANVDPKTDSLIQNTIREKFADCTVLTIAHRLHTIVDADRVLVLDAGHVVEFDEPHILLQNENGIFSSMVRMTGKGMAQTLKETAKLAHDNKKNKLPYHKLQLETLQHKVINNTKNYTLIERDDENDDDNTDERANTKL